MGASPSAPGSTNPGSDLGRLLWLQSGLILAAVTVSALWQGQHVAVSALYGGLIALVTTGWMARRVRQASDRMVHNAGQGAVALYAAMAIRFVLVVVLLALGLGALKLSAPAMLLTLLLTQLATLTLRRL